MDIQPIQPLLTQFAAELPTDSELIRHAEEHKRRIQNARALLQPERISRLSPGEFIDFLQDTDANYGARFSWDTFRERNFGSSEEKLPEVRETLKDLVERAEAGLEARDFRYFCDTIHGIGKSFLSEILALRFPERYWVWNKPVEEFLGGQGIDIKAEVPDGQKTNDGALYFAVGEHITQLREALGTVLGRETDYMLTDLFIWWVQQRPQRLGSLAKLLQSIDLSDLAARDAEQWAARVRPVTRPVLQAIAERWQEHEMPVELEIRFRIPPASKERVNTLDHVMIRVPHPALGELDVGVFIGLSDHPQQESIVGWGATWWGKIDQMDSVKETLQQIVKADELVYTVRGTVFGGAHCRLLCNELLPEDLPVQEEEALIEQIAADLVDLHGRLGQLTGDDRKVVPRKEVPMLTERLALYFSSCGLHFSHLTLATYFTALQTKGFVILSGLSGTGKTKLAQHFAEMMQGGDQETDNYLFLPVRPDWRDSRPLLGYYNPLTERYETSELLRFILDARQEQTAPRLADLRTSLSKAYETEPVQEWLSRYHRTFDRLSAVPASEMSSEDLQLLWHEVRNGIASVGQARSLKATDDQLREATRIIQDTSRTPGRRLIDAIQYLREIPGNVTPWARTLRALAAFDPISTVANRKNLRELLDLLGYERSFRLRRLVENEDDAAIDHAFAFLQDQMTRYAPTTDPLLRAITPWLIWELMSGQAELPSQGVALSSPFFVLLDEMNLSRVEYYFADFLSVLEGGRREHGFTRETVRLHDFPANAIDKEGRSKPLDTDGRYVHPELQLPPNLYFVGTVNIDETTHAFSPKVLDRAFTIEITEVDLERYPPETAAEFSEEDLAALNQKLLPVFTRDGRFAVADKREVRAFVAAYPKYRAHLDGLKKLLQPYDLHFAYRVFDEIIAFCANAEANGLWADLGGLDTAFDCAVLMKVLPKFHGPRSKLNQPLCEVLAWALSPDDPGNARQHIEDQTRDADACLRLRQELDAHVIGKEPAAFRYPHTGRKAARMLQALYAVGFASFA